MAHQFGLDAQADARWIALTQMIERGAGWLDQVLQRWPSPESILGDSAVSCSAHSETNVRRMGRPTTRRMIGQRVGRLCSG